MAAVEFDELLRLLFKRGDIGLDLSLECANGLGGFAGSVESSFRNGANCFSPKPAGL